MERGPKQGSQIAYLQGLVAARLFFEELMRVIVPMTSWWHDRKKREDLKKYKGDTQLDEMIQAVINWTRAKNEDEQVEASSAFAAFNSLDRYVSLAAIILWAATEAKKKKAVVGAAEALAKEQRWRCCLTSVVTRRITRFI